jgi:hypothetical protein
MNPILYIGAKSNLILTFNVSGCEIGYLHASIKIRNSELRNSELGIRNSELRESGKIFEL